MTTYKCGSCNKTVEKGVKYCSNCGSKLSWPKKKKAAIRKPRKEINLPIDPEKLNKLVFRNGDFRARVYCILTAIFCPFGLLLSLIMNHQQKKIRIWLEDLRTEEYNINYFKKRVRAIRCCGSWAVVLTSICAAFLFIYFVAQYSQLASIAYSNNLGLSADISIFLYFLINFPFCAVGIATGRYVEKLTNDILLDCEENTKYTYKFEPEEKHSEEKAEESFEEDENDDEEF